MPSTGASACIQARNFVIEIFGLRAGISINEGMPGAARGGRWSTSGWCVCPEALRSWLTGATDAWTLIGSKSLA
jgi:hypothetical protein